MLAFLPGVAEIERTAERIEGLGGDIVLHRLHGSLDPGAQRAAIAPDPQGRRKIVLATSIAETSLTLDGISVVVDSGLARRPRYDRAAGMTPARHRAGEPGRGDPARRPRRAADAGYGLSVVGGSGDRRPAAFRSAGDIGGGPVRADARLRAVGRSRPAHLVLARSAARCGDRRSARPAGRAGGDRCRRQT